MPYIEQQFRDKLDPHINALANEIIGLSKGAKYDAAFAGLLNYSCTRLSLMIIYGLFGSIKYWCIATVRGVMTDVRDEFYRRLAVPYENKKIESSGDVDYYKKFDDMMK